MGVARYQIQAAAAADLHAAAPRLRRRFAGPVHLPGDPGYDATRRPLNPALDPRPAIVVEAERATDVREAVTVAREHDLPLAVQATGHGTHVPVDGAVLLRTGSMATVLVDPDRRVARVGPGARWGAVLAAATPFGLAPLSGSSASVGVTGYTLGGGLGWLARRYGFAADSVIRANVVTADGRSMTVDADRGADLFWALRGGGGNFGVVTSLEFRLYPVSRVYAGAAYFDAARAGEFLARYRDWAATAPDEMSTAVVLRDNPDGRRVLVLKAMYTEEAGPARRLIRPLWTAGGTPRLDEMTTVPYADAAMGGTPARYQDLFPSLPDPVIDALVTTRSTVELRHRAGAMVEAGGPVGHRTLPFAVVADQADPDLATRLGPYGIGGSFLNFLADTTWTATAYSADDYARLRRVKAAYDPENLFRTGHNIPPAM